MMKIIKEKTHKVSETLEWWKKWASEVCEKMEDKKQNCEYNIIIF